VRRHGCRKVGGTILHFSKSWPDSFFESLRQKREVLSARAPASASRHLRRAVRTGVAPFGDDLESSFRPLPSMICVHPECRESGKRVQHVTVVRNASVYCDTIVGAPAAVTARGALLRARCTNVFHFTHPPDRTLASRRAQCSALHQRTAITMSPSPRHHDAAITAAPRALSLSRKGRALQRHQDSRPSGALAAADVSPALMK